MNFLKQYNLKNYKLILPFLVIVLSCFSVLIVGSAKESVQDKQILGVIIGIICMIVVSLINYNSIFKYYWICYIVNILLLLSVSLWGFSVNGAQRWIDVEFTTLQPSELVKILIIIFYASYFTKNKDKINNWLFLIQSAVLFAIPIVFILSQPDLSTTISITLVFLTLIFLAGLDYKIIATAILIVVPITVILFAYVVQPDQILLKDYQQKRVLAWLQPEEYSSDEAYQQNNSMIAIGSGELTGKGLNNNTTTSVKNGNFILEPQTDFIFAIIGEELGFLGCLGVIILLLLIIIQCVMIGVRSYNLASKLFCYGFASQIAYQSFINIGVATGVLPNTGIPLPFVSYGLSSLISMFIGIGIILNIGLQQKRFQ